MATVPSPRTWGSTEAATNTKFNVDIRDSFEFINRPPRARLRKTVDQSCNTGIVSTITWDSEEYDTDGGHSNVTNNSRYTSQTAGWYYLSCSFVFALVSNELNGTREVCFQKNGNGSLKQNRQDEYLGAGELQGRVYMRTAGHMYLAVNDYVEVLFHQDSGTNGTLRANITSYFAFFSARWVRS